MAYYPNSDSKFQRFKKAFQGVEEHGAQPMQTDGFKTAPWLLKTGLTPQEVGKNTKFTGVPAIIVLARYLLVRPLQEVGCGKIEMHSLAQDGALQSASAENMLSYWKDVPKELPILADLSRCEQS